MNNKTIILIDGENLVARYQSLCKSGLKPSDEVFHTNDVFVWHPEVSDIFMWDVLRVCFYSTVAASDDEIQKINDYISTIKFNYTPGIDRSGSGTLNPHLFAKNNKTTKTKSVDINITIDALRHAFNKDVSNIVICSGDGDYIPLVKEIMRHGVIAQVAAFSSGCSPLLRSIPDDFIDLDGIFFDTEDA